MWNTESSKKYFYLSHNTYKEYYVVKKKKKSITMSMNKNPLYVSPITIYHVSSFLFIYLKLMLIYKERKRDV